MNRKCIGIKSSARVCAMAAALTAMGVSAVFGRVTVAEIPVKVNVPATVTLSPVIQQTAWDGDSKALAANVSTILTISIDEAKTPILHGRQDAPASRAAARYSNGTLSIQLPTQQYRSASVTLYSMSGKRVLGGKASASDGALSVSRANVAPGVYLLSIKGDGGNTYSTRVTHNGGRLNLNAKFGAGDIEQLSKEASSMSSGTAWKLTAVADGYKTFQDTLIPNFGLNTERVITLVSENVFTDSRDGKTYKMVTIGTQVWMAENLNYRNTTGSGDTAGVCYNRSDTSCTMYGYGRLYRWVEVMNIDRPYETTSWIPNSSNVKHRGICPAGWHVPSSAEWDTLTKFVGGVFGGSYWNYAGTKLKSKSGWNTSDNGYIAGTDDFGFSALPGGVGFQGQYYNAGDRGHWWSATEYSATDAWYRLMYDNNDGVYSSWYGKNVSYSLRCLRD